MTSTKGGERKTAVISGGAGGLGTALSERLQDQGWRVVLLDRDIATLAVSDSQQPMQCDLTDPEQLASCCAQICADHARIALVIYSAGVTTIGPVSDLTDAAHRQLFEINYFAAATMAQAFQGALRQTQGTHLVLTSVAGFAPLRQRAAYAASKHAMAGFFGSLRAEEEAHGVQVCIAAPSFVATNPAATTDPNGLTPPGSAPDAFDAMTADQAAKEILRGLNKGKDFVPVGRVAKIAHLLTRLSPTLYQWVMARMVRGKPD
ncbi:SDR family NAD(P)-dependent oxidoreductase [Shimia sp. R10_1]|uniref:SDR family NAD(P)-dependent oxidoreductase n=1 Tax=Shimia sp. R10_1 TaxID=2821095 RepID=UPI001AD981C8|nr:SDR family NAD(P)-dependent oxidoreductase [Shimia sp. R10_1]